MFDACWEATTSQLSPWFLAGLCRSRKEAIYTGSYRYSTQVACHCIYKRYDLLIELRTKEEMQRARRPCCQPRMIIFLKHYSRMASGSDSSVTRDGAPDAHQMYMRVRAHAGRSHVITCDYWWVTNVLMENIPISSNRTLHCYRRAPQCNISDSFFSITC